MNTNIAKGVHLQRQYVDPESNNLQVTYEKDPKSWYESINTPVGAEKNKSNTEPGFVGVFNIKLKGLVIKGAFLG